MKLYREVKCNDRLPEEGIYHTIGTTNKDGSRVLESLMFVNGEFENDYYEVDLWLEEFDINEDANCVRTILQQYLIRNGFDGLYYPGECSCITDDLMPCEGSVLECEPGYLQPDIDDEFDFKIGRENNETIL